MSTPVPGAAGPKKRLIPPVARHRAAVIFCTIVMVLMIAAIPWDPIYLSP